MKILILGGGLAQLGLIRTAKKMGLEVVVVGIQGQYPGYQIADKVYYEDIFDKETVFCIAKKEKIDGIAMACSDFGLETLGYVNDHMGFSGLTEQNAIDSSDKMKMKLRLCHHNVNTAKFKKIEDNEDIKVAVDELSFPLIVKAVDLQGSRGIYICRTEEELLRNYKKSIEESRHDYCIVEEYIEGNEFGAQAFVQNGKVLFVQPHGDEVLKQNHSNIPIGHYVPFQTDDAAFTNEVYDIVANAIIAMGFNNCAVNADLIEKNGTPYIIELTGRAGANSLPEMMSEYLGVNYYELILRNALGESIVEYLPKDEIRGKFVSTRQLFASQSGIVRKIENARVNGLSDLSFFVKEGDVVHQFQNSNDCIGRVVFSCKNREEFEQTYARFKKMNSVLIDNIDEMINNK